MEYITTAVVTALFTVILIVFYKYVINPQMILRPTLDNMGKCPDNWEYVESSKMCEPRYQTHCTPFDPEENTMKTVQSRCNVARTCGTTWGGFCT